ncbi:MAG: mechanosensitive ion channel family protein [Zunongwangia sp.]|uniref:mechanosensitive ion channel family protein n=1 Tax=Zunongwangia sp. TaxID=1965325 RepID=UPI00324239D8
MDEFLSQVYLGNTVKSYLIALGAAVFVRLLIGILHKYLYNKVKKIMSITEKTYEDLSLEVWLRFLIPLIYLIVNINIIKQLRLSEGITDLLNLTQLIFIVYYVIRVINLSIEYWIRTVMLKRGDNEGRIIQLGSMLSIVKGIIWIAGFMIVLENRNVDVKTFIAGLGIGGIAIALAAQNILGDVFNYFAIFFDKPFEVGDFISFGTHFGTIENIGIKTTRFASINGQQLIVANTLLTGQVISNFQRMPKRRMLFQINVEYNTSYHLIEKIPSVLEEIVKQDPEIIFDRSHLLQFGASSIDYEVVYFVSGNDYKTYMDKHQRICLDIYKRFEQAGISFAFPSQTIYIERNNASKI